MTPSNDSKEPPGGGLPDGARVGKYEIVGRIGVGGQAIVYKGYDSLLDRPVAIKQISSHLAGDPRFTERFHREAQILARLGGERTNIVAVHDLVTNESGLFLVMEYVPGHTLREVLDRQRHAMPTAATLQIIWHIARGLAAAHAAGIVHRDVKPGNILVTRDYNAKISDFGVAARAGGEDSLALGTTKYMAPEVFGKATVDARTDIYSLGFIAYEMLTGREFFTNLFSDVVGDPHTENLRWMKWHADPEQAAPRLADVNPKVPRELSDIVARMMAKDPAKRYAGIDQVIADLNKGFGGRRKDRPIRAGRQGPDTSDEHLVLPDDHAAEIEEPLTAPIPRIPMRVRTKVILGVSMVVLAILCAVALAVYVNVQRRGRESLAVDAYRQAKKAYDDADAMYRAGDVTDGRTAFASALKSFEQIAAEYGDLSHGANAAARAGMCQAWIAMLEGRWGEADQCCKQVIEKGILPADETAAFKSELSARRTGIRHLDGAAEWLGQEDFVQARSALEAFGRITGPAVDLDARARQLRKELELKEAAARKQREFRRTLASGDAAVERANQDVQAGRYDDANDGFREAFDLYTQARGIFDNEAVTERFKGLELAKAMADYVRASVAGNLKGQVEALKRAVAARPTADLTDKLRTAQAEEAFQRGEALLVGGRLENMVKARDAFAESLAYKKLTKVDSALQRIDADIRRTRLMIEADDLVRAGRFDDAVKRYTAAATIRGGSDVAERLTDARVKLHNAAAEGHRRARRWDEALLAYERLRQVTADDEALAEAAEDGANLVASERKYYEHLDAGKELAAAGEYRKAEKQFAKAQAIAETEELAKDLIIPAGEAAALRERALYDLSLSQGKAAHKSGDLNLALAHFRVARRQKDTEEIRSLIAQVQAEMQ